MATQDKKGPFQKSPRKAGIFVNPFRKTIEIKGCSFMEDQTMDLDAFKQMCFENNWEGTLLKVMAMEKAIGEYVLSFFYPATTKGKKE